MHLGTPKEGEKTLELDRFHKQVEGGDASVEEEEMRVEEQVEGGRDRAREQTLSSGLATAEGLAGKDEMIWYGGRS